MAKYKDIDLIIKEIEYSTQTTWGKGLGKSWWAHSVKLKNNIIELLKDAPTPDVVEVVRCKDCIHWGGVTYGFVCRKLSGIETKICMGADHFCSYGERKDS